MTESSTKDTQPKEAPIMMRTGRTSINLIRAYTLAAHIINEYEHDSCVELAVKSIKEDVAKETLTLGGSTIINTDNITFISARYKSEILGKIRERYPHNRQKYDSCVNELDFVISQALAMINEASSSAQPVDEIRCKLNKYFTVRFSKIGDIFGDRVKRLSEDLMRQADLKSFATFALLIYNNTKIMNAATRPQTFKKWLEVLCEITGRKFVYYKPCKLSPNSITNTFPYLMEY
jgi:hypothetical protein